MAEQDLDTRTGESRIRRGWAAAVCPEAGCRVETAALLAGQGFAVASFDNASAFFLQCPEDDPPAIVIADFHLPGTDGWRFCRSLRSSDRAALNRVPVVVVSREPVEGHPGELTADFGLSVLLPPPFDAAALERRIGDLTKRDPIRRPERVLVVEDSATDRAMLAGTLKKRYRQVFEAETAAEGRDLFCRVVPDVVVLDYRLPDVCGDVLLREFKADNALCAVIMVTVDPAPEVATLSTTFGADGYLRKPFDAEYLLLLCERAQRERSLLQIENRLAETERQLQDWEERVQLSLAGSNVGLYDWHAASGQIVFIRHWAEILGYAPGEIAPNLATWCDALHPDDRLRVLQRRDAHLEGKTERYEAEYRMLAKSGEWRWIFDRGTVIERDESGRPSRMVGIHLDVTDRKRTEDALRASEARTRLAMEMATDAIVLADAETGMLVDANRRAQDLIGRSLDEIRAMRQTDLHPPEECEHYAEIFRKHAASGFATEQELCLLSKDGRRIPVGVTAAVLEIEGRRYVQGIFRDITERKCAEEALRDSEALYSSLVENLPLNIFRKDLQERFTFVNSMFCASVGLPPERFIGKTDFDFYSRELAEKYQRDDRYVVQTGKILDLVEEHPGPDGETEYVEVMKTPVRDAAGRVIGVQGIFWDITERKRATEEVQRSEERLRALFEGMDDALFVHDDHGRILDCNEAACRRLCYTRQELLSMNTSDIDDPEFAGHFGDRLDEQLSHGRFACEGVHVAKDGRKIPVDINTAVIDFKGQKAVLAVMRDITERKRAEEWNATLRDLAMELASTSSLDRALRAVLYAAIRIAGMDCGGVYVVDSRSGALDMICATGLSGKFQERVGHYNAGTPRAAFVMAGEPVFGNYDDLGFLEDDIQVEEGLKAFAMVPVRHQGRVVACFNVASHSSEEVPKSCHRVLEMMAFHIGNALGRMQAEDALRENQERYRNLVETIRDWIWETDANGVYRYASPRVSDILGYEPAEVLGKTPLDFAPPEERDRVERLLWDLIAQRQPIVALENVCLRKDGQRVTMETNGVPFFAHDGTLLGYRGADRDITERKLAESERRRLERQMQQAQKLESLGVLAGGIAHDFNNLLTGILGHTDLALRQLPPGSRARDSIRHIEKAATRAADLTRQMLAYSGKGKFVVEPIDLSEVVQEMANLLEVSISKKCALRFNFPPELPRMVGDVTQVRQIIMNLILNASEAIGEEPGIVSLSTGTVCCDRGYLAETYLDESLVEGRYVFLEVSDTGCGMDPETRKRLFEPFFTTKFTGRGLGLAAVLGIVRGHQGAIKVYSELGKGTTFKVLFPAAAAAPDAAAPPATEPEYWTGTGTILVVDDELTVRELATEVFESAGFRVLIARDGREAIEIFRQQAGEVRVVLLDLTMPHMDGEETFRELRRMRADIPVILSSGYNEQEATNRFAGKGLAGFIQKPYRVDELLGTLRAVLEGKAGRTAEK